MVVIKIPKLGITLILKGTSREDITINDDNDDNNRDKDKDYNPLRPIKKRKKNTTNTTKCPKGFYQHIMKKIRKKILDEGTCGEEKEIMAHKMYTNYKETQEFIRDKEEFKEQLLKNIKIEKPPDNNNESNESDNSNVKSLNNDSIEIKKENVANEIQSSTNNVDNTDSLINELEVVVGDLKEFNLIRETISIDSDDNN